MRASYKRPGYVGNANVQPAVAVRPSPRSFARRLTIPPPSYGVRLDAAFPLSFPLDELGDEEDEPTISDAKRNKVAEERALLDADLACLDELTTVTIPAPCPWDECSAG